MAIFGFFFLSAVSNPCSVVDLDVDAQSAEEIALLEELANWIEPGTDPFSLRQAIRDHNASFEVFRSYHGEELRTTRLDTLPFSTTIRRTAERYRVDAFLLASIIEVESGFDPEAVSHRGATGLMQLMPSTAGTLSTELYDPELNVDVGARYLQELLKRYEGDLGLALAAYNAGPTRVSRYGGMPPFRETKNYVEKVLSLYVDHHRRVWRDSDTFEQLAMM